MQDLESQFSAQGLPLPPIPEPLRPALRTQGPWCWSTRDIDPIEMYRFNPQFIEDALAGRTSDYVAVSHAGHGVNSYTINYHLVYGRLAVLMQVLWGGVYTDNAEAARDLAVRWGRVDAILQRPAPTGDGRLVVVYSLRGYSVCGWTTPSGEPDLGRFARDHETGDEDAFEVAERLWSSGSA